MKEDRKEGTSSPNNSTTTTIKKRELKPPSVYKSASMEKLEHTTSDGRTKENQTTKKKQNQTQHNTTHTRENTMHKTTKTSTHLQTHDEEGREMNQRTKVN
ncbi:hypothetical protein E2C01_071718 [Portunus trituberculatus]|uniref:Uncharacterized protein n=1 Tax=Portunus trituberculatus TaxID=210409 RepID=A0A5B7I6Y3_PORTR|nr:hypothetical protein [Portunus trituberculatus]